MKHRVNTDGFRCSIRVSSVAPRAFVSFVYFVVLFRLPERRKLDPA
jgi:hypothetical protein